MSHEYTAASSKKSAGEANIKAGEANALREQIAENKRVTVKNYIKTRLSTPDFVQICADTDHVSREELAANRLEDAEAYAVNFEHDRDRLIDDVMQKDQVEKAAVSDYLDTIFLVAREFGEQQNDKLLRDVDFFVRASDNQEKADLYLKFTRQWKEAFLSEDVQPPKACKQRLNDLRQIVGDLSGFLISSRQPRRSSEEESGLFLALINFYKFAYKSHPTITPDAMRKICKAARQSGLKAHDPAQPSRVAHFFQSIEDSQDEATMTILADVMHSYSGQHDITEDLLTGWIEKLVPAIRQRDEQVSFLLTQGNRWGMRRGDYGVGDFICTTYASRINPDSLNRLLLAARSVPSTNLATFEQNRRDALSLAGPFGNLRDFIHDQRPYVHEVLVAMVHYYETGNDAPIASVVGKTDDLKSPQSLAMLLDRALYQSEVIEDVDGREQRVQAIDLVRRLAKNTEPVAEIPPHVSDERLNEALTNLATHSDKTPDLNLLGTALEQLNSQLLDDMGREEVGLEPNTILAIGWLERKAFNAMQSITFERQASLVKKPWFRSLLLFQELTWAPGEGFNKEEFDAFLASCDKAASEGEEVAGNPFEEGYLARLQQAYSHDLSLRLIAERTREHVSALARRYTAEKRTQWVGALWSGNVAHELIGLTEQKEATTLLGKRIAREKKRPFAERLRGD